MNRLTLRSTLLFLSIFFCFTTTMTAQQNNLNTNSGSTFDLNLEFSVGEIYTINTFLKTEEEIDYPAELIAFPNPAFNVLYLESASIIEPGSLIIIDIHGRQLQNINVVENQIQLNNLAAGIYYLLSINNQFAPVKFIKR